MALNEYIRNEWQPLDLVTTSTGVGLSSVKCSARQTSGLMMVMMSFDMVVGTDIGHISISLGLPSPQQSVRAALILTHLPVVLKVDSEVRYSQAMLEHTVDGKIRCVAFPFRTGRKYNVNAQYFYRPQ